MGCGRRRQEQGPKAEMAEVSKRRIALLVFLGMAVLLLVGGFFFRWEQLVTLAAKYNVPLPTFLLDEPQQQQQKPQQQLQGAETEIDTADNGPNVVFEGQVPDKQEGGDTRQTQGTGLKTKVAAHLLAHKRVYLFSIIAAVTFAVVVTILVLSANARAALSALQLQVAADPSQASTEPLMVTLFGFSPFFLHPLFTFFAVYVVLAIALIVTDMVVAGPKRSMLILRGSPLRGLLAFALLFIAFAPTLFMAFMVFALFGYALIELVKQYRPDSNPVLKIAIKLYAVLLYLLALPFLLVMFVLSIVRYVYTALVQVISCFMAGLEVDAQLESVKDHLAAVIDLTRGVFGFVTSGKRERLLALWERRSQLIPLFRKEYERTKKGDKKKGSDV